MVIRDIISNLPQKGSREYPSGNNYAESAVFNDTKRKLVRNHFYFECRYQSRLAISNHFNWNIFSYTVTMRIMIEID